MLIRFLQTVQSENPDFPFMAGQTIAVDCPSPYLLDLLDGVRAVAVKHDGTEYAVPRRDESPEPPRSRKRSTRGVARS